jgi:hypothetical protein
MFETTELFFCTNNSVHSNIFTIALQFVCFPSHSSLSQIADREPRGSGNMFKDMPKRGSDLSALSKRPSDLDSTTSTDEFANETKNRERLVAFYTQYNPENSGNIDQILVKFKGKEAKLFKSLQEKYPGSVI